MYRPLHSVWAACGFAALSFSQPLITCGSQADQYFHGGIAYPCSGSDSCASIADQQYQNLRFGTSFRYDIPVTPALYAVELRFIEPNQTAAGKRRFQVTVGGQPTPILDLFALAGRQPYILRTIALAGTGVLTIQFQGILGNAVISAIQVRPARQDDLFVGLAFADFLIGQLAAAPVAGVAIQWQTCAVPSCAGQDRFVLVGFDGQHVQYVAQPVDTVYDATMWRAKFP